MASATKRIILSTGWVKIAEAKGRDAMAMIDAYGSVQLAVAEGEPPRGDVASGHSLNGSMMWPVKGAEIIWARGAGVAVSVTLLKVVPEFATLDSAALKVATASAQAVATAAAGAAATADAKAVTADNKATAADAKATEAQAVQARRDFGKWQLVDYLAIFLSPAEYDAVLAGNTASQNEIANTMAVQAMHDDFMTWWNGARWRTGELIYPAANIAINDELFSEAFADALWGFGASRGGNRVMMRFDNTVFTLKNWTGRAAVRTSGYFAEQNITYPVPKAVFRWMQKEGRAWYPKIIGAVKIMGEGNPETDPVGVWVKNVSKPRGQTLDVQNLMNTNVLLDNVLNGDFDNLDAFSGGFQPTEYGGDFGHLPASVRFSNVGSSVQATEAVFDASHVGKYFGLAGASFWDGETRLVHWSTIASVDSPTQITLSTAPAVNVTGVCASFEAIRASTSGTTWTMSASLSESQVGRLVTLVGARHAGSSSNVGTLTTTIISHSGNTITVADAPVDDVTDALLVFSPLLWIGGPEDGTDRRTDNVGFSNLRLESTDSWQTSCVPCVISNASTMRMDNAKLHGSAVSANNFGGTAGAIVLGRVNGLTFDGALSQATRSPRYGAIIGSGGWMVADFRGKYTVYPENNRSAMVYLDPILPPEASRVAIYMGMSPSSPGFPTAQQVPVRLGANGRSNMILSYGSERRSGQAGSYMFDTLLGRVEASVYAGSGVADTTEADDTKLMRVGHGHLTGTTQPPVVADLNDVGVITNRRVRAEASTLNKPDGGSYIVELLLNSPNSYYQLAHRLPAPGIAIRRYNGTWSSWRFLQTTLAGNTASRPAAPVMAEQYFDTTLGHPIWWNGTAWVDATGTTV